MLKIVLDDYKHNLKTGFKYYYNSYMVSIHTYLFFIVPIVMREGRFSYYFMMVPVILAEFLAKVYGCMENRTLFFCPLSKEQREIYFKTSLWLRISIPMILLGISGGILIGLKKVTLGEFLIFALMMFLYTISINICCLPDGKMLPSPKGKMNPTNYFIWNVIIHADGFVNLLAIISEILDKKTIHWIDGICIGSMTLLQIVAFLIILKRYYEPVKQVLTDYEVLRGIRKNEEKGEGAV
ncbi:MAG: hypothetical protein IJA32_03105 [Lachnospiraceae bacterium]|nr:hypothetical protein [Lachnospiraceae bacterium]